MEFIQMNKALLLAGAACVLCLSTPAKAQQMFGHEIEPYIGADYIFTSADFKKAGNLLKEDYNGGAVNIGTRLGKYAGLEAYYQMTGERKAKHESGSDLKSKFRSYGLDLFGYLPLGCADKVDLLASVGAGNYTLKVKGDPTGEYDKDHMGYRFGIGAQYNFNEHVSARVMGRYTYVDTKYLDSLMEVNAGLRYTF